MTFVVYSLTTVLNDAAKMAPVKIKETADATLAPLYHAWRDQGADCRKKEDMISFLEERLKGDIGNSLSLKMATRLQMSLRSVKV